MGSCENILYKLALALVVGAGLSGCQAAIFAAVDLGLSLAVHATELDTAIVESIREQTGLCVNRAFQTKPCPQEPAKP